MGKVRVGVVGVGYFGSLHASNYVDIENAELIFVCDVDETQAKKVAAKSGAKPTTDWRKLIGAVDAVSVAVPRCELYSVAREFLARGIHVIVEKPFCETLEQADELIQIAETTGLILHVGYLEQFQPAYKCAIAEVNNPLYIESKRCCEFSGRNVDTNVVQDLMVHDLDLIFRIVNSPLRQIDVFGKSILNGCEDFANVRIEFENRCVANLTASRISNSPIRSLNIIQPDKFLSIDFLKNECLTTNIQKNNEPNFSDFLEHKIQKFSPNTTLQRQLRTFLDSVIKGSDIFSKAIEARKVLEVAISIDNKIARD